MVLRLLGFVSRNWCVSCVSGFSGIVICGNITCTIWTCVELICRHMFTVSIWVFTLSKCNIDRIVIVDDVINLGGMQPSSIKLSLPSFSTIFAFAAFSTYLLLRCAQYNGMAYNTTCVMISHSMSYPLMNNAGLQLNSWSKIHSNLTKDTLNGSNSPSWCPGVMLPYILWAQAHCRSFVFYNSV